MLTIEKGVLTRGHAGLPLPFFISDGICIIFPSSSSSLLSPSARSNLLKMAALLPLLLPSLLLHLFLVIGTVYAAATFTITNNCDHPVWPGVLANAGTTPLSTTGFLLQPGESKTLSAPTSWSGRFWGRTFCTQNSSTSNFSCLTGDCGSNDVECAGAGAAPPTTLAEFTLNGADGLDFYDVSLVDGYNLPMLVVPQVQGGGDDNCSTTGCMVDVNSVCPSELKVASSSDDGSDIVACKSACEAFQEPEYCCSGDYGNPDTCKPSSYSEFFKRACPRAYSYAYDDKTSTFTCASASYLITFCPPVPSSQKSSQYPEASALGGKDVSVGSRGRVPALSVGIVALAIWQLCQSFNSWNPLTLPQTYSSKEMDRLAKSLKGSA